MLAKRADSAMDWHRRLGHINYQTLNKMKNDPTYDISYGWWPWNKKLQGMPKQTRNSFPKSETKSSRVLELVHSDLAGPMENLSYGMVRYMLVFVDDYSNMVFIYFIEQKSQALETFKKFKNLVENQTGEIIKILWDIF